MTTIDRNYLTDEQRQILDKFINGKVGVYCLMGKAGVGKSTVIEAIVSEYKKIGKKVILLGTTGIAAVNIGGQTIHKFFGFKMNGRPAKYNLEAELAVRESDAVIIDENSMLRADIYDMINEKMQDYCGVNDTSFGGKKVLLCGDLFQLPPVVTKKDKEEGFLERYKTPFFFSGKTFKKDDFKILDLKTIIRQKQVKFANILNKIRVGTHTQEDIDLLNKGIVNYEDRNSKSICLCTVNATANEINNYELSRLDGKQFSFYSESEGECPEYEDELPAPKIINVKIGARVMITKNNFQEGYQNGTLGKITKIENGDVYVEKDDGGLVIINKHTWEFLDKNENPIGKYWQYPLKLAYAITIHKSQGKTFDNVYIDMGWGAFTGGQTYVALSRCTTLEGLQMKKPLKNSDIIVNPDIIKFLFDFKNNKLGQN